MSGFDFPVRIAPMFALKLSAAGAFSAVLSCAAMAADTQVRQSSLELFDRARQRAVPVELYFPPESRGCAPARPCPIAILSAGTGIGIREYGFIARPLAARGYLVVSVDHQLPTDPAMPRAGDLAPHRRALWERNANNIRFVQAALRPSSASYVWDKPLLVGHSSGGDSSAWIETETPGFASAIITLDHRRAALPRGATPPVLSIRASDTEADAGVLPTAREHAASGTVIVKFANARHNDMFDGGGEELKARILAEIEKFLQKQGGPNGA